MLHIALLRAVNLGAHNKVRMADLCQLCTKVGLKDVRSLLQSGNLVFDSEGRKSAELETVLEGAAKRRLGLETDIVVRTAGEWKAIVTGNPFAAEAKRDPSHLVVMVLKAAPARANVSLLKAAIIGREEIAVKGRQAYLVYPDGIGDSRLTTAMIERKLGTRGTGRNWNTTLRLAALAQA